MTYFSSCQYGMIIETKTIWMEELCIEGDNDSLEWASWVLTCALVYLAWVVFGLIWVGDSNILDWGIWPGLLKALWGRLDLVIGLGLGFD